MGKLSNVEIKHCKWELCNKGAIFIKRDQARSLFYRSSASMYRGVGETTADLIALGDSVYKRSPAKRSQAPLSNGHGRFGWTEEQNHGGFASDRGVYLTFQSYISH